MSKAVLVMDMPEGCCKCPISRSDGMPLEISVFCRIVQKHVEDDKANTRPSWCPLKPLPEKQKLTFATHGEDMITMGWNACIEAIEGEQ